MRLNGVSVARLKWVKPPASTTFASWSSVAWLPSPSPPAARACGVHSNVDAAVKARPSACRLSSTCCPAIGSTIIRAVGGQGGIGALRGFGWIAHVVQAIEERDQVKAGQRRRIGAVGDHLKRRRSATPAASAVSRARSIDGAWISKPTKREFGRPWP